MHLIDFEKKINFQVKERLRIGDPIVKKIEKTFFAIKLIEPRKLHCGKKMKNWGITRQLVTIFVLSPSDQIV